MARGWDVRLSWQSFTPLWVWGAGRRGLLARAGWLEPRRTPALACLSWLPPDADEGLCVG